MIETSGKIVITYDIEEKHNEIKNAVLALGHYDDLWIFKQEKKYKLTNTTLWHKNKRVSEATRDIKKICNQLNVNLICSFSILADNEVDCYNNF